MSRYSSRIHRMVSSSSGQFPFQAAFHTSSGTRYPSPSLTPVAFSHLSQRLIDDLSGEFMIFSFRLHQELVAKQKPPDHQGRRFATSPAEILFGEFPHRTSAGIFIPAQGTVALHCSVARLISESFLMSPQSYRNLAQCAIDFWSITHCR